MRIMLGFFCVVLIAGGLALAADTGVPARKKVLNITEVTSPGGLKAWLVEDHGIPVIALKYSFKDTGSAYDPADKQGLARMVSNTMDEGAGELDSQSFQKELQDLVIDLHFSAGRDYFGGEVKTLTRNKDRAFELLRMALTSPRFDAEAVERMRQANLSRIRSSVSDPEWIAARIQNDVAYSGHAYAMNSGGTLTSLNKITADDLRSFTKKLARNRLAIAVAGDITPQELATLLDKVFGALPASSEITPVRDTEIHNAGAVYLYKQDIPQTVIEIMQPGIDQKDPDFQTAQVMNFILGSSGFGSRLTKEIREVRGLTYGIYSYLIDMEHSQGLSVSTSTKNGSVKEIIDLTKAEWEKMKTQPVSAQELEDAKSYLIGSLPLSLTSTDQIAAVLHSLQLDGHPIDYLEQREDKIRKTSTEDVARVAKRLLDADKFVTVLVGQPEGMENAKILDTLPNVE